jgi:hypothetical protein
MVEDPDSDGYVDVARPLSTQRNSTCPLKIVMSRLAVFSLVRLTVCQSAIRQALHCPYSAFCSAFRSSVAEVGPSMFSTLVEARQSVFECFYAKPPVTQVKESYPPHPIQNLGPRAETESVLGGTGGLG